MLPSPTRYLLDTNILVHYIRGGALAQWIEAKYALRATTMAPLISIVTVGEIRSLALQFGWGAAKRRQLDNLLNDCVVIPLDFPGITDAYAEIDDYSRRIGRKMGKNDIWIAATTKAVNARLLTTDNDFDHLDPAHIQCDWIDPKSKLPGMP